jgi:thymidylate kinase
MNQATNQRTQFLAQLPQRALALRYGVLKAFGDFDGKIAPTSDLDILIDSAEAAQWIQLCQQAQGLCHLGLYRKSNVIHLELYFEDRSYLELDLLTALRRKSLAFMAVAPVLARVEQRENGWKCCHPVDSLSYLFWFYGLNGAPVPEWYLSAWSSLSEAAQQEWEGKVGKKGEEALAEANLLSQELRPRLFQLAENKPWKRFARSLKGLKEGFSARGATLTFSGVDGAGKSTIIQLVREMLSTKYRRKLKVLRHRPSILPILSSFKYGKAGAEQRAATRLPRQGANQSRTLSLLRFAYYYLDYLLGQFFVYFAYNLRGYTVLYDRYYFDFIVDAKRSNLVFSSKWAKKLLALLRKPELNFLIYAAPQSILARKQELSHADITQLTSGYRQLFDELDQKSRKSAFLSLENEVLEDVINQIEKNYLQAICHA